MTAAVTELRGRGYDISLVLLVPVYRRNPVGEQAKNGLPETYEDRVRLAELAAGVIGERLAGTGTLDCAVKVSQAARELAERSGGPNYDLETLRYVRDNEVPGSELLFLMSAELVSGPGPGVRALARAGRDRPAGHPGDRPPAGIPAEHEFPQGTHRGRRPFHLPA